MKCNVIVIVRSNKILKIIIKDYENVSKITPKQRTITISIESEIYKRLYVSIDDIRTTYGHQEHII